MKKTPLLLLFVTLLLDSCQPNSKQSGTTVDLSFYHWKNSFQYGSFEQNFCAGFGCKQLYIKFLDADWQEGKGPVPRAVTDLNLHNFPDSIQIIPVVFIVNRVFAQTDSAGVEIFADKLFQKISAMAQGRPLQEIQIDCDWTKSTRAAYFLFLQQFKKRLEPNHIQLSATIRLYQLKYRTESGVPPVDRGALMLYNLTNPTKNKSDNSIFDRAEVQQYLNTKRPYPIPLDLALPLFSWGLHFRAEQFQDFLSQKTIPWANAATFLTPDGKNKYRVTQDTVLDNIYLRPGDQIRIESVSQEDLESGVDMARPFFTDEPSCRLIFFHLDPQVLSNYDPEKLKALAGRLGKR